MEVVKFAFCKINDVYIYPMLEIHHLPTSFGFFVMVHKKKRHKAQCCWKLVYISNAYV